MSDHFFTSAAYGIYSQSTGCYYFTCSTRVLFALPRLNSKVLQLSKSLSLASVHQDQLVSQIVMQWHVAKGNPFHRDANDKKPGRHVGLHRLKSVLVSDNCKLLTPLKFRSHNHLKKSAPFGARIHVSHSFAAAPGHHWCPKYSEAHHLKSNRTEEMQTASCPSSPLQKPEPIQSRCNRFNFHVAEDICSILCISQSSPSATFESWANNLLSIPIIQQVGIKISWHSKQVDFQKCMNQKRFLQMSSVAIHGTCQILKSILWTLPNDLPATAYVCKLSLHCAKYKNTFSKKKYDSI